jgi:hypothetical protein
MWVHAGITFDDGAANAELGEAKRAHHPSGPRTHDQDVGFESFRHGSSQHEGEQEERDEVREHLDDSDGAGNGHDGLSGVLGIRIKMSTQCLSIE